MAVSTLSERARSESMFAKSSGQGFLGRPAAYIATTLILFTLFGWTFVADPQRVAPTKDPAYYTWRTEALLSERPVRLLEVDGAFDMFAGGYRVAAPVMGGFLRHIAGVSSLKTTVLLMVAVPVVTALLLAGFAYRQLADPVAWHAVAYTSAGLFLTPPFVGYLDNILCLFFLAAALPFLAPARRSWPARLALFLFLLLAGFTHPTTLVIFIATLGAMAGLSLVLRRFDLRSVVGDDGPTLVVAVLAAAATYALWTIGIWGEPASLTEAALAPPYESAFFLERFRLWVATMNPLLNGPLFVIGLAGLWVAARNAQASELARVSVVWLAPLAGLFGFLAGLTYPYYRFFNTTLAWVLIVGVGAYVVVRFALEMTSAGGAARFVGAAAIVVVVGVLGYNFFTGFKASGWNKPQGGWISADQRTDLDALRTELAAEENRDRPVVFVIDETPSPQVWGFTKLSGNTSRYGLPAGQIDNGYLYLGSLDNYLAGEPTEGGETTYDRLSPALLEDAERGIGAAGEEPITVVASAFNAAGTNAELASGGQSLPQAARDADVWVVHDGAVQRPGSEPTRGEGRLETLGWSPIGILHLGRVIAGLALLNLSGAFIVRWALPEASLAEGLGLAPAFAFAALTAVGVAALAVTRSPLSPSLAWVCLGATLVVAGLLVVQSLVATQPRPGHTVRL